MKSEFVGFLSSLSFAYSHACQPVCRELQLTQTAFDILMFLANHPEYNTARDICRYRGIKSNLVSFTVDKLVREGYLFRRPVPEDRRKIALICTEKSAPVIERGRTVQNEFSCAMMENLTQEDRIRMESYMSVMQKNADRLRYAGNIPEKKE